MSAHDTSAPPLDLDAVEARAAFYAASPWDGAEMSADDVPALAAEVRRLRGLLDATAQAFDDLVAQVWRAAGETHEPPADVAALLRRVSLRAAQLAHAIEETASVRRALCDAEDRIGNLRVDVVAARREGAEAMREACAKAAEWGDGERFDGCHAGDVQEIIEGAIRALPLPGGEP